MTCPACGRPVALARSRCLYCGAPLPAEAVAAAAESAKAVSGPRPPESHAPRERGVVLVLDLTVADASAVAGALALSPYEASQRVRRGGLQLLRVAPTEEAEREAQRLAAWGLTVIQAPEAEVRTAASPVVATGGRLDEQTLRLGAGGAEIVVPRGDLVLAVRGPIVREYETLADRKRFRTATLDPGYRFHLHRAADPRPVELDPGSFSFDGATVSASSLLVLARWVEAVAGGAPIDDLFRRLPPALAPALPENAAAEALVLRRRKSGGKRQEAAVVLDNVAQFRFYSAWRAAAERRRHGPAG